MFFSSSSDSPVGSAMKSSIRALTSVSFTAPDGTNASPSAVVGGADASSYDVHFGTGAVNSPEVLARFRSDLEEIRKLKSSDAADDKIRCEARAASSFGHQLATFMEHFGYKHALLNPVAPQGSGSGNEVLSLSLTAGEIVNLLDDDCAAAQDNLVPEGMEQFRVLDRGITVLFPRNCSRSVSEISTDGSLGIPTKASSSSLLNRTLDILARSATIRSRAGSAPERKPGIRLHWNDKLIWRVAVHLASVFAPEALGDALRLDYDNMSNCMSEAGCVEDKIYMILEEWRANEDSRDLCPQLLDLLSEHKTEQDQLQEMFKKWRRESEFLPAIVNDKMVSEVARQIGSCWRNVAYELNMSRSEVMQTKKVQQIEDDGDGADQEDANVMYARGMLGYWRQTSGRYATRSVLAHALSNCNLSYAMEVANERSAKSANGRAQLVSLVKGIMRNRRDELSSPESVPPSASDRRKKRLAKKRIMGQGAHFNFAESVDAVGPPLTKQESAAPWEATSLVKSGPYYGVDPCLLPGRSDGSLVPLFVDKCIAFIEERGMTAQGIYRISGISSAIAEVEDRYTKDHDLNLFEMSTENPGRYDENCIASSFKSFLRKFPDPIIPEEITSTLAEVPTLDQDVDSMVDRLKLIVVFGIPSVNRATLQEVCLHLKRVSEHASENLMKASNLGVVFWPTLMRPELQITDLVLMRDLPRLLQNVMTLLIEHAEQIFIENQPW